nr:PKD domain-containing protein [Salinivirgaceae bacterium]
DIDVCTPNPTGITLNNTTLGGLTFTWQFSDSTATVIRTNKSPVTYVVDNTDPNAVIHPKVYLTATASNCSNTDSLTLNVYPHIVPHIEPDVISGCGPLTVNLANLTTGGNATNALTYYWDFANGENSSLTTPVPREFENKTATDKPYNVTLTATNELGCNNLHDTLLTVFPEIIPAFSFSKPNECSPINVALENSSLNGTLYRWDFGFDGNGMDTVTKNIYYEFYHFSPYADSLANYTIKLVVMDDNHPQCNDSVSYPITIYPPVVADFTVSNNERGCSPLNSEFTNNSTGYDLTYVWNYIDNNTSGDTSNVHYHQFENLTSDSIIYDVRLTVDDINACRNVAQQPVTAFSQVIADFTFKKEAGYDGCTPFNVDFTYPLTALNGNEFKWDFSIDRELFTDKSPFQFEFDNEYEDIQTYTIKLISEDTETGCSDTATRTLEVYPQLIPEFNFVDDTYEGCNPLSVGFENESTGIANYLWDYGDKQTSSDESPTHVFGHFENSDQVFDVTLTATQKVTGCVKSINDNVTVYSYLNPKFGIIQADSKGGFGKSTKADQLLGGCHPFNVQITDSSTCNGTWSWDFGDDTNIDEDSQPTIRSLTYYNYDEDKLMQNAQYTIALEVENQRECTKKTSQTLEVYPRSAPAIGGDFEGCHPHTVTFKNNGINDADGRYYWRLGDGATSVEDTLSHAYYNSSYYDNESFNVKLISTTGYLCSDSIQRTVVVYPKPLAAIKPILDRGCSPLEAVLENTSKYSSPFTFIWDFDKGAQATTRTELTTESIDYINATDKAGIKYVTLIAQSDQGCTDTVVQLVNVYPEAEANFIPSVDAGCSPLAVNFTNLSNATTTLFNWEFGNGTTSQLKNPSVNFFNDGVDDTTFTVRLVSNSPYGCDSQIEKDITVYLTPNAEFLAVDPVKTYPDTVITFSNLVKPGPWTFDWNYGDGHDAHREDLLHSHAYDGWGPREEDFSYTVTMKVYSDHCEDETWQVVTINPPKPYINIIERNPLGCVPLEIDFFVKYGFGYSDSITWNFGNGDYSYEVNPNYIYEEPGLYISSVTIKGDGGLFIDTTRIDVYPLPEPGFEFRPDFVMLPDQPVQFFNTTYLLNQSSYFWDFGDGTNSTEIQPSHLYTAEGVYDLKLVATTLHGCKDSLINQAAVEVSGEGFVIFPNAFMPSSASPMNGAYPRPDTENNVFHPYNEGVKEYQLWIFNRWGEQVFHSDNVDMGWNGRYGNSGAELGQDVYFWKTKGKFNNNVPFKKAGDVTLIRK